MLSSFKTCENPKIQPQTEDFKTIHLLASLVNTNQPAIQFLYDLTDSLLAQCQPF